STEKRFRFTARPPGPWAGLCREPRPQGGPKNPEPLTSVLMTSLRARMRLRGLRSGPLFVPPFDPGGLWSWPFGMRTGGGVQKLSLLPTTRWPDLCKRSTHGVPYLRHDDGRRHPRGIHPRIGRVGRMRLADVESSERTDGGGSLDGRYWLRQPQG